MFLNANVALNDFANEPGWSRHQSSLTWLIRVLAKPRHVDELMIIKIGSFPPPHYTYGNVEFCLEIVYVIALGLKMKACKNILNLG